MSADLGLMPHLDLPQTSPLNPPGGTVGFVGYTPAPPLHQPSGASIPAPIGTPFQPPVQKVIDYGLEFPELEKKSSPAPFAQSPVAMQAHNNNNNVSNWPPKTTTTRKIASSNVTQVFHLPAEERRHLTDQRQFGDKNLEQEDCNVIMKETGTQIELCESRDHSLTIVVSGKRQNVEDARIQVVKRLQTQATREVVIPTEHHRFVIGKEGKKLQELEHKTACRILIPKRDSNSDIIKISGPRDGIDRAIHEIQQISDEQSKLAQEKLVIPKIYYPWVRGPNNETVSDLLERTGAKINIPPPSSASETIIITGEKEGVYQAAREIRAIYEEKKKTSQTVSIQVAPAQHRHVAGPQRSGIHEILKATGVSVELPHDDSGSSTITLRGEPDKLGLALSLVYEKASSIIEESVACPSWLHRFIIGPKGQNIKKIVGDPPTVSVTFIDSDGLIFIEGPPNEVKQAKSALAELSAQLQAELTFEILHINPAHHRYIIGRSGANVNRIKDETGVLVNIPDETTSSDEVRLEGKKEMVTKAKELIMEIINRVENEKSRDILIDQRFHGQIIGSKGEAVRELRDKFPGVNVSFPEPGRKSDVVTLRGPKEEVDKCYKHLSTVAKDLTENNFQVKVPIFKDFHRNIIGKGGQNIRKIREETDTRIDLPAEGTETDVITITGKKVNVEKAKQMLTKIQNELASIVTLEVVIPAKVHSSLLFGGFRLIHSIQDECGSVNIKFPPENSNSDKVTIRGPKDDAEKAKKMLMQLAKDKELCSFHAEVKSKPELFRFLIGRGGHTIKKIRDEHPNVRIMFPRQQDEDQETIHLIGKKEEVEKAQKSLEDNIVELNKIVEITMDVDPKWHKHFVARRAQELRDIQAQFGGVTVSFPRQGTNSSRVLIKGAKECAEAAKKRIGEIVEDLEAQITIRVAIPQIHHRTILANKGAKVQDICHELGVQIKFPERNRDAGDNRGVRSPGQESVELPNGNGHVENGAAVETAAEPTVEVEGENPRDFVFVSGRADKCQLAKEKLEALIPITEVLNVPYDLHRFLIGQKGDDVRKLMRDFEVNISIPPRDDHRDDISVSGTPDCVRDAIAFIMKRVEALEEEAKDRELRSHHETVHMPAELHTKLIGPKGTNINRIRAKFNVNISVPRPDSEHPEEITITGYEKDALACKEEIERMVQEIESLFTQETTLDARIHNRLIGPKGKNIRKIMEDYKVEIRFPRQSDPDPNLVAVSGSNEDCVYDCIDHLRNLEEEYLQDVTEFKPRQPQTMAGFVANSPFGGGAAAAASPNSPPTAPAKLVIINAPWEAPNITDMQDFPSMGNVENGGLTNGGGAATGGAWGRRN